ncbi:unnamed protein product, partial [Cylindrotheca closterium]
MIISAVKARVRKTTHKYGIEIPTSVEHAKRLDAQNGNNLWMKALSKEMSNIGVAVEVLAYGVLAPPGYSKVTGHLVWDVKMDFTRKARWVLDGHKTPDPLYSQYAGVVSRESVRIAFTYAALNNLDVFAADIRNAYLQAPSSRKDYIICGPEFGLENVGKVALIHRALYGGKTAGRDFRNHLRACMHHLDFLSCPADPDVWMRPAMKDDGSEYWEYVLLCTDDALCVSMNPERVLRKELGKYFELKEESIGPPKIYLGSNVRKVELDTGVQCWAFGSSQYVQAAVKNVERYLNDRCKAGDERFKLKPKAMTPMQTSYRPELDVSPELEPSDASYYQSLIGVLRWIVELGRVDICLECSLMSSQLAMPRVGHLHQVLSIFSYLKSHHNAELVLDPTFPVIDAAGFERKDWSTSEFGHIDNLKEELPPNQPEPKGIGFVTTAKVDADHASDTTTRRSRTGFFVWVNGALVYWMAKKQTAVESSSFGSEFCTMKLCCEYLRGLRYKLRMMGIPVLGPSFIYGDNKKSVLANTSIPDSQLNIPKKQKYKNNTHIQVLKTSLLVLRLHDFSVAKRNSLLLFASKLTMGKSKNNKKVAIAAKPVNSTALTQGRISFLQKSRAETAEIRSKKESNNLDPPIVNNNSDTEMEEVESPLKYNRIVQNMDSSQWNLQTLAYLCTIYRARGQRNNKKEVVFGNELFSAWENEPDFHWPCFVESPVLAFLFLLFSAGFQELGNSSGRPTF